MNEGHHSQRSLQSCCVLSHFSRVQFFATPWTIAHQAPLSVGFSRQEYWSRLPFSPPGDLPDPGIELAALTSPALTGGFFTTSTTKPSPVPRTPPHGLGIPGAAGLRVQVGLWLQPPQLQALDCRAVEQAPGKSVDTGTQTKVVGWSSASYCPEA